MSVQHAYDYIANYIALLNPEKILALKASPEMQERLEFLIKKGQEESLTKEEQDELNHYIVLERLVRLAKTRAQLHLARA